MRPPISKRNIIAITKWRRIALQSPNNDDNWQQSTWTWLLINGIMVHNIMYRIPTVERNKINMNGVKEWTVLAITSSANDNNEHWQSLHRHDYSLIRIIIHSSFNRTPCCSSQQAKQERSETTKDGQSRRLTTHFFCKQKSCWKFSHQTRTECKKNVLVVKICGKTSTFLCINFIQGKRKK